MSNNFYGSIALTGGGSGALDAIDGASLNDLDGAVVITASTNYIYTLDADSGAAENSPYVIAPDNNPGNKRWILVHASNQNLQTTTSPTFAGLELTRNLTIPHTTYNSGNPYGIIYKGADLFIHNFNYGYNGQVTTVGYNTFVGKNCGNLTMGSSATGVDDASYNTGVGEDVMPSLTIGKLNVGIGRRALYNITIGAFNTGVGVSALYSLTEGINNNGFGVSALYSLTTGSGNTAFGRNAGRFIANGSSPNTIPTDSCYLGRETKANADGEDNQIVIGYNTTGLGSNSVVLGNTAITKTVLRGNIGINTTGPDRTCEINSATGINLRLTYNDNNGSAANYVDYLVSDVGVGSIVPSGAILNVTGDVRPTTDNTYYLGENSLTTPQAWKGIIVKDTTNGNYYRIEVINGVLTATVLS